MDRYIVATRKAWNHRIFTNRLSKNNGEWRLVTERQKLTAAYLEEFDPNIVFFPHWSWLVPDEIVHNYECIAFHMTDLPYGRGGSPLQNLISRGHKTTKVTALRMTDDLDAGPIYCQRDLSLSGTAESVYLRAAELTAEMIEEIISERVTPIPQEGEVVEFSRRTPEESEVKDVDTLDELHDLIRMLDAEGYPKAYIERGGFRYEFTRSARYQGEVRADVRITRNREGSHD